MHDAPTFYAKQNIKLKVTLRKVLQSKAYINCTSQSAKFLLVYFAKFYNFFQFINIDQPLAGNFFKTFKSNKNIKC